MKMSERNSLLAELPVDLKFITDPLLEHIQQDRGIKLTTDEIVDALQMLILKYKMACRSPIHV